MADRGQSTILVHAGRDIDKSSGFVNMPIAGGSTVLYKSAADMRKRYQDQLKGNWTDITYGTGGGPTHQAFFKAINELTGAYGTWAFSTGLAGCVIPFFAFVEQGDHVLVTDSVYGPTREFLIDYLAKLGVEVQFYEPTIGADIEKLVKENTKVIFMESPGSHTFEMQDVPAIVEVAKKHNVWTMIDNTWATPLYFNPLKIGVDVEIQAATKYIGGHSDILLATVSCNERAFIPMMKAAYAFGQYASPDTIYLAHRGMRSMKVRTQAVYESAKKIVNWLEQQPEVVRILWPANEKDPGYPIWKRDFTGASGVFGVELSDAMTDEQIDALLDAVKLFGLGYSWGGYESLMIRSYGHRSEKTDAKFPKMIRLSVGLEDTNDLINDLNQAFEVARQEPQEKQKEKEAQAAGEQQPKRKKL